MRQCLALPFLLLPMFLSSAAAAPQSPQSAQPGATTRVQSPHWTEADRKAWLAKANRGDVGAQFWLGAAYEQGWFGSPNVQEALRWFKTAAAHGNPDAQFSLGQMYEDGEGVSQNYSVAAKWYRKAAEHVPNLGGAGQGRSSLGQLYLEGLGVPKDYTQAYMWFLLANSERDLSIAKPLMSPAEILEAERMAKEWKRRHPEP